MRSFTALCLAAYASAYTMNSSDSNPFEDTQSYYVNPSYRTELQSSIDSSDGSVKEYLTNMMDVASAYWIDTKSKITGDSTDSMEGILKDAASKGSKQLVTIIVYDLPNRDCHVSLAAKILTSTLLGQSLER